MLPHCVLLGIKSLRWCFKAASQCTGPASLELQVLLLRPLECWGHRCVSPCLALIRNLFHSVTVSEGGQGAPPVCYVCIPVFLGMARLEAGVGRGGELPPSLAAEPMETNR